MFPFEFICLYEKCKSCFIHTGFMSDSQLTKNVGCSSQNCWELSGVANSQC